MKYQKLSLSRALGNSILGKFISTLLVTATLAYSVAGHADAVNTVDINSADSATLARVLNGVGESLSKAIIKERSANGPFLSVDDLQRVNGIGTAVVDKNRTRIVLGADQNDRKSTEKSTSSLDTATGEIDKKSDQ